MSTMLLLKAGWGPTGPIAVAGELHPVPRHWTAQGQVGCGGAEDEGPALALPCANDWAGPAIPAARCVAHPHPLRPKRQNAPLTY